MATATAFAVTQRLKLEPSPISQTRVSDVFHRLGDTTAQIRVRGSVLLLIGIVAIAERFGLETILGAFMAGVVLLALAVNKWRLTGFGNLDYRDTLRWVVPGATLTALGVQTMLSSFFVSILGLSRR